MPDDQPDEVKSPEAQPRGELVLRTLAMPADTNPNQDIFGGWLMSQMDIGGSLLAREIASGRVVTIAVDGMKFIHSVEVGDIVCCYADLIRIGTTSITLNLEVWIKPTSFMERGDNSRVKVTEAVFTYVAIDAEGKKRPVSLAKA
jgi:acyl-CoA thioesterase YciA